MYNRRRALFLCSFLCLCESAFAQTSNEGLVYGGMTTQPNEPDLTGRFFIVFHAQPGLDERTLVEQAGATILHSYKVIPAFAVYVPSDAIAQAIAGDPRVSFVEPDKPAYAWDAAGANIRSDGESR